jgi:hypothetical protein
MLILHDNLNFFLNKNLQILIQFKSIKNFNFNL